MGWLYMIVSFEPCLLLLFSASEWKSDREGSSARLRSVHESRDR